MINHANCTHDITKSARAACRQARSEAAKAQDDHYRALTAGYRGFCLGEDAGLRMIMHAARRFDCDVITVVDALYVLVDNNIDWNTVLRINS